MSDMFRNGQGYADRTAGLAIRNADKKQTSRDKMVFQLLKGIRKILQEFDIELIGRIKIKDLTTGKEYK